MQFDTCYVLRASGGGPFAVACAKVLSTKRLLKTGVMAGMGPVEHGFADTSWQRYLSFQINRYLPEAWLHRIIDHSFARHVRNSDPTIFRKKVIDKIIKNVLPPKDAALYNDPKIVQEFEDDWRQAFAQGAAGYALDSKTIFSPWEFDLADVKGKVRLWYGTEDHFTPVGMGRYLASNMPDAKLTEPAESHASVSNHAEDILRELTQ